VELLESVIRKSPGKTPFRPASLGTRFATSRPRASRRSGLRASRALIALLATLLVFAGALSIWGFKDDGFWSALLLSAQSTTSLLKPSEDPNLRPFGDVLYLVLRLLGPLLFALALLAFRGRVKR
jgi:hypothetical protein